MIYRLAIEEVAYALGVRGGSEAAAAYLRGHLGDRPAVELNGRLLAAGHALVARGLLAVDAANATRELEPAFDALVTCLEKSRCTVALTARTRESYAAAGLHYSNGSGGAVEQRIESAVVACLEALDAAAVEDRLLAFFGLRDHRVDESGAGGAPGLPAPLAILPAALLEMTGAPERTDAEGLRTLLVGAGLPAPLAVALAADRVVAQLRGSLLRLAPIALESETGVEVQQGLLVLVGEERAWLIELAAPEPELARLYRYHPATWRALLTRLTS